MSSESLMFFGLFLLWAFLWDSRFLLLTNRNFGAAPVFYILDKNNTICIHAKITGTPIRFHFKTLISKHTGLLFIFYPSRCYQFPIRSPFAPCPRVNLGLDGVDDRLALCHQDSTHVLAINCQHYIPIEHFIYLHCLISFGES